MSILFIYVMIKYNTILLEGSCNKWNHDHVILGHFFAVSFYTGLKVFAFIPVN